MRQERLGEGGLLGRGVRRRARETGCREGEKGEITYTPLDGRGSVILRYGTGDLAVKGVIWETCPSCGRTCPRLSSDIRRVSQVKEFNLTKVKGTLVDLNAFVSILGDFADVDEWQAEIRKRNNDPYDLDDVS